MSLRYLIRISVLALLGLAISSCAPKSSDDCGFVQNVYGQRISWKTTATPITVYIDGSVPQQLRPAIHRAAASWETSLGKKMFNIVEENTVSSPQRDKKNGIYFLSTWESDRRSEQGRTSVYWAGDEIQEADIRINGEDFSYYDSAQNENQLVRTTSTSSSDGYNFEALILHELGHFLGLKHRDLGGTVMEKELGAYTDRIHLASVDTQAVQCEYK